MTPGTFETFSSSEVSKMAHVSLRQLQWWDERGIINPRHSAHRRCYTREDALEVILVAELRDRGLSLQKIRSSLKQIRRKSSLSQQPDFYILVDSRGRTEINSAVATLLEAATSRRTIVISSIDRIVAKLETYVGNPKYRTAHPSVSPAEQRGTNRGGILAESAAHKIRG